MLRAAVPHAAGVEVHLRLTPPALAPQDLIRPRQPKPDAQAGRHPVAAVPGLTGPHLALRSRVEALAELLLGAGERLVTLGPDHPRGVHLVLGDAVFLSVLAPLLDERQRGRAQFGKRFLGLL